MPGTVRDRPEDSSLRTVASRRESSPLGPRPAVCSPTNAVVGQLTGIWKPLPKVVFSTTLSAVQGNARLASGGLVEEIERLRVEPGEGDIAIGGATLAAEAAASGMIDEYRARVHPVLVGGGIPFLGQRERPVDLELVETRTFSSRVVYLRYRVAR